MCQKTKEKSKKIPAICQFWRNLQNRLPSVSVLGLDVNLMLLTMLVLTCLRYIAEYVLISVFGWPADNLLTKDAAASIVSILHSLNLVPALWLCFLTEGRYQPSQKMSHASKWWQETVTALLQFCTGYMVYDAIINILWLKSDIGMTASDWLFFGHHVATTLYMTSTRIIQAGHESAMMCMFLGELTNPLHNSYYIAEKAMKLDCCNGPTSQQLHDAIQVSFAAFYVVMRAIVGPAICLHMSYDLWVRGRHHINLVLLTLWTAMIWGVIFGSMPWIQECWEWLTPYLPASVVEEKQEL